MSRSCGGSVRAVEMAIGFPASVTKSHLNETAESDFIQSPFPIMRYEPGNERSLVWPFAIAIPGRSRDVNQIFQAPGIICSSRENGQGELPAHLQFLEIHIQTSSESAIDQRLAAIEQQFRLRVTNNKPLEIDMVLNLPAWSISAESNRPVSPCRGRATVQSGWGDEWKWHHRHFSPRVNCAVTPRFVPKWFSAECYRFL